MFGKLRLDLGVQRLCACVIWLNPQDIHKQLVRLDKITTVNGKLSLHQLALDRISRLFEHKPTHATKDQENKN